MVRKMIAITAGTRVVCITPRLDNIIMLESTDRGSSPVRPHKYDIRVYPGNVTCLGSSLNAKIQDVLFTPPASLCAHADMPEAVQVLMVLNCARTVANEVFLAIRALHDCQVHPRVEHMLGKAFPIAMRSIPVERV